LPAPKTGKDACILNATPTLHAASTNRCGAEAGKVKLTFADEVWEDYFYWQKQDTRMVDRINKLIRETQREPFAGVGKPEALKHALSGFWSRRTTDEHRMVYRIEGAALLITQLRFHC
jgi:toxin YoeB